MARESLFSDYMFITEDTYTPSYDIPKENLRNYLDLSSTDYVKYNEFQQNKSVVIVKHTIPAIIIEANEDYAILNCLVDKEKMKFQRRKFDIEPLKGELDLIEGEGLLIIIETKPGERKTTYQKDDSVKFLLKEPKDRFSRFAGTSVFPE